MARPLANDPLVIMNVRIPFSLRERLRAHAAASGVSVSDAFRAHITHAQVAPLGKPTPRRRQPKKLGRVSGADPQLLAQLVALGNNLNQIARRVNRDGVLRDSLQILSVLRAMEHELHAIASHSIGTVYTSPFRSNQNAF